MMMLHDRVTITSTLTGDGRPDDMTVPAHVHTVSATGDYTTTRPGAMVQQLRVIIGATPRPIAPATDQVVHHGTTYRIDGPPMGRYRRGRLHHWTINLERTTG